MKIILQSKHVTADECFNGLFSKDIKFYYVFGIVIKIKHPGVGNLLTLINT